MKTRSLKYIITSIMLALSLAVFAEDNYDIIVTNDGESLKVYNLDYSSADYCYYTSEPNGDDLKRMKKSEVLIIKLADGIKVDPTSTPQRVVYQLATLVQAFNIGFKIINPFYSHINQSTR